MRFAQRYKRSLVLLAAVIGLVLVPTAASTIPNEYQGFLFGLATADGDDLLVADSAGHLQGGRQVRYLPSFRTHLTSHRRGWHALCAHVR
jgi:hypothetical protein